jgi:hypothetical protein
VQIDDDGVSNYDKASTIDILGNGQNNQELRCEECGELFGEPIKNPITFTAEEAAEVYYALESKISAGIAGTDKKWKADIEAIMEKIGEDGVNLITK